MPLGIGVGNAIQWIAGVAANLAQQSFGVLQGLVQWLTGSYYTDDDGYPVDGTILDKSKLEGGYPDQSSGYSLTFDGSTQYGALASSISIAAGQDFNVCFWLNLRDSGAVPFPNNQTIIARNGDTDTLIAVLTDATIRFSIKGITYDFAYDYSENLNKWTHVAITADRDNYAKLYINGYYADQYFINTSFNDTLNYRFIASRFNLTNFLDGALAGMLIVTDNVLSPDQITELYNGALRPTGISQSDIALDLRIIEGAGSLVKDYSTNSNDGTLIGGPTWTPNIPYGQQMHEAGHNVRLEGSDYINIAGTTEDATTDIEGNAITFYPYDADRFKLPTEAVQVFDGVDDDVSLDSEITYAGDFDLEFVFSALAYSNSELVVGSTGEYIRVSSATQIGLNTSAGVSTFTVALLLGNISVLRLQRVGSTVLCFVNGQLVDSATNAGTFKINNIGSDSFDGYIKRVTDIGNHQWTESGGYLDEIGSNDGTINGSPTSENVALTYANHATPKTGIVCGFDGVGDGVTGTLSVSGVRSLVVLFKLDSYSQARPFSIRDGGGNQMNFNITGTGQLNVYDGTNSSNTTATPIALDTWYHVVLLFNADNDLDWYVNGVFVENATSTIVLHDFTDDNYGVGRDATGSTYMNGQIASVKLFDSILTPTQIQQLYKDPQISLPTGVDLSNLVLDLRLDDAATTTARDYSGNANDGTLSSATMWLTGFEYPVKQLCLTNFNIGVNDELIFGLTDDATVDIDGNPISDPRLLTELNFPYTYHNGLVTSHRDSMNPTNGITLGFVTEYSLENTFDVIISKGDDITAANSIGVRTIGGDFQLMVNTDTLDLGYAPALTGTHSHIITVDISGNYKWYIDGVLIANGTINAAPTNSESLYYGQDATDGREYAVPVGDYIFYNNVVDATEVLDIYNNQKLTYQ